jgi:signal transduction histidine kinase
VIGNEAGLTQCFSNLLGNAVKFIMPGTVPEVRIWAELRGQETEVESQESETPATPTNGTHPAPRIPSPPGGQPTSATSPLATRHSPPVVRIWFEDNGIGIPKEAQGQLFQIFQRATTAFEGTGVGLALVKRVAEQMEGSVGMESEEEKGSRFWLELRAGS